jgi:hypothetical protein
LPWPRTTATIPPVIEAISICAAAFAASGLTLFAGFGLGTLLMPVVALFFPVDVAIAITALVHRATTSSGWGCWGARPTRVYSCASACRRWWRRWRARGS